MINRSLMGDRSGCFLLIPTLKTKIKKLYSVGGYFFIWQNHSHFSFLNNVLCWNKIVDFLSSRFPRTPMLWWLTAVSYKIKRLVAFFKSFLLSKKNKCFLTLGFRTQLYCNSIVTLKRWIMLIRARHVFVYAYYSNSFDSCTHA